MSIYSYNFNTSPDTHQIINRCLPISREYEPLNWSDSQFNYPGLVRIRTIGDGSCFFHAIANAFFKPYKLCMLNGVTLDRTEFIRNLRRDLSIKLGERINPNDPNYKRYYDLLSRGQLQEFSKGVPKYTLENMQRELNSDGPVDNVYNEFISNILDKDIYMLNLETHDVYVFGNDDDILYKHRPSIVLITMPGHYELIGLQTYSGIQTLFNPDDDFIQYIRRRMSQLISLGSNNR